VTKLQLGHAPARKLCFPRVRHARVHSQSPFVGCQFAALKGPDNLAQGNALGIRDTDSAKP